MKRLVLAVIAVAFLAPLAAAQATKKSPANPGGTLQTEEQKTLYALGAALAQQMRQAVDSFSLTAADNKLVLMGIRDAFQGEKLKVDMQAYGPKINELGEARVKAKAAKQKEKDKQFLADQSKAPGAQVFPSGLIYFEVKAGTGAVPSVQDSVKAFYKGTLSDGNVFDASSARGDQPAEFPLSRVIPCWTEAIQKMKVGGKAKLVCPSDIAYGDMGHPPVIPGGAVLVFEVELAGVVKAPSPAAPAGQRKKP